MIAGIKKNVLIVDEKLTVNLHLATTSVGSLFQMCGAATNRSVDHLFAKVIEVRLPPKALLHRGEGSLICMLA